MKRVAAAFVLFIVAGFATPQSVRADSGRELATFDGMFGGTVSKFAGTRKWQPSLWIDGTYSPVGPLHIGGYFQWLARSFPLDDPGFGGGALIALRADIKKLRISGAFTGGYLGVPLPERVDGSGTIGALARLGYGFLPRMGFELRGSWMRNITMTHHPPKKHWTNQDNYIIFEK